jgi:hypothetical protein
VGSVPGDGVGGGRARSLWRSSLATRFAILQGIWGEPRESHRDAARSGATHAAANCADREDDKDLLAKIDRGPGEGVA